MWDSQNGLNLCSEFEVCRTLILILCKICEVGGLLEALNAGWTLKGLAPVRPTEYDQTLSDQKAADQASRSNALMPSYHSAMVS